MAIGEPDKVTATATVAKRRANAVKLLDSIDILRPPVAGCTSNARQQAARGPGTGDVCFLHAHGTDRDCDSNLRSACYDTGVTLAAAVLVPVIELVDKCEQMETRRRTHSLPCKAQKRC